MLKRIILKFSLLLSLSLFVLALSACGKNKNDYYLKSEFKKIEYRLPDTKEVQCFALSETGTLWILGWDGLLTKYGTDGNIEETFEDELFSRTTTMRCVGDKLYLAQQEDELLREWNTATKTFTDKVIELELEGKSIHDMVAAENKLFILTENELISVDYTKEHANYLTLTNISAIYGSSNGKLYYCCENSTKSAIYCYDEDKVKNADYDMEKPVCDLTNILQDDRIRAFVLENDYLVYASYVGKQVKVFKISDLLSGIARENTLIFYGRDMQCVSGNVVYYRSGMTSEEISLENFYLPNIALAEQNQNDIAIEQKDAKTMPVNPQPEGLSGKIKIATTDSSAYYNIANVNKIGNIKADLYEYDFNYKTELMAGDDTYDIYFLYYNWDDVQELKRVGYYEPLNNSELISGYCGKCFDYIEEAVTADNGDIFALPLSICSQVVWYVPENFEKYGLELSELVDYESYLDLSVASRKYDEQGITQSQSFVTSLLNQYEMYYNDYNRHFVNFKTDLYYQLFDKLWTGWNIYSQTPIHPMLNEAIEDDDYHYYYANSVVNKKDRILFYTCDLRNEDINLRTADGWRVRSAPRLSAECNPNLVYGTCAIINPASKNKELAIAYLETIAANPSCSISNYTDLFFDDKSIYENRHYFMKNDDDVYEYSYNMSTQVMCDLFDIFKNGKIEYGPFSDIVNIADSYQNNRYTLDEAIDELQREMEMELNE